MPHSTITLAYEPNYTEHRAELQRRVHTKHWLAEQERRLEQYKLPSVGADTELPNETAGSRRGGH